MSRKLRALGLTVLALCGLTALMATSAQANWLENGAEVTVNKEVKAKAHTEGKLLISSLNFEIRCPTLDAEEIKLTAKSTHATGKVKFLGCEGFQISPSELQKNCTPHSPGQAAGTIVAGGQALIVKYATEKGKPSTLREYILLENIDLGEKEIKLPFTTVELPELCALAETSEVKGSLLAECGELNGSSVFVGENCSVAQKVHLLQAAPIVTFYKEDPKTKEDTLDVLDELLFGENKAKVDGIASTELASGNPWAGDA
jgi:hypothetical protein